MEKSWTEIEVARAGDMNPDIRSDVEGGKVQASLRLVFTRDGDIILYIDHDGIPVNDGTLQGACVEFCATVSGGGGSPRTRDALRALATAMEADNKERPDGFPKYPIHLHRT